MPTSGSPVTNAGRRRATRIQAGAEARMYHALMASDPSDDAGSIVSSLTVRRRARPKSKCDRKIDALVRGFTLSASRGDEVKHGVWSHHFENARSVYGKSSPRRGGLFGDHELLPSPDTEGAAAAAATTSTAADDASPKLLPSPEAAGAAPPTAAAEAEAAAMARAAEATVGGSPLHAPPAELAFALDDSSIACIELGAVDSRNAEERRQRLAKREAWLAARAAPAGIPLPPLSASGDEGAWWQSLATPLPRQHQAGAELLMGETMASSKGARGPSGTGENVWRPALCGESLGGLTRKPAPPPPATKKSGKKSPRKPPGGGGDPKGWASRLSMCAKASAPAYAKVAKPPRHAPEARRRCPPLNADQVDAIRMRIKAASYSAEGRDLVRLFKQYDKDKSGELCDEEIRSALRRSLRISPAELPDVFILSLCNHLDADKSGFVSIDELVKFVEVERVVAKEKRHARVKTQAEHRAEVADAAPPPVASPRTGVRPLSLQQQWTIRQRLKGASYSAGGRDLEKLFRTYDKDKSGELCDAEVKSALRRTMRLSRRMVSDEEVLDLCNHLDADKSGFVSIDELVSFIEVDRERPEAPPPPEPELLPSPHGGAAASGFAMWRPAGKSQPPTSSAMALRENLLPPTAGVEAPDDPGRLRGWTECLKSSAAAAKAQREALKAEDNERDRAWRPGGTSKHSFAVKPSDALSEEQVHRIRNRMAASAYNAGGKDYRALFKSYDKDGSGAISFDELSKAIRRTLKLSPIALPGTHLTMLCKLLDADESGTIDLDELCAFLEPPEPEAPHDTVSSLPGSPVASPKSGQRRQTASFTAEHRHREKVEAAREAMNKRKADAAKLKGAPGFGASREIVKHAPLAALSEGDVAALREAKKEAKAKRGTKKKGVATLEERAKEKLDAATERRKTIADAKSHRLGLDGMRSGNKLPGDVEAAVSIQAAVRSRNARKALAPTQLESAERAKEAVRQQSAAADTSDYDGRGARKQREAEEAAAAAAAAEAAAQQAVAAARIQAIQRGRNERKKSPHYQGRKARKAKEAQLAAERAAAAAESKKLEKQRSRKAAIETASGGFVGGGVPVAAKGVESPRAAEAAT